jgi:Flp pilus assembly protein TadG
MMSCRTTHRVEVIVNTLLRTPPSPRRPRRGATIVLVAILLTVLVGLAGFAIDFARMYAFKAQLKVLSDAAALSAVTDLKFGASVDDARTRAVNLRISNVVENTLADITADDIEPGQWNANVFTVTSWTDANAVRATARHQANWTLARIFGVQSQALAEASIAALGSYVSSACLAPFAIPYSSLLERIGKSAENPLTYQLSDEDIATLSGSTGDFTLSEGGDPLAPGSFTLVNFTDGNGNKKTVEEALLDILDGCTSGTFVSVGDWIDGVPGSGGWQGNQQVWRDVCGGNNQLNNCTRRLQIPIVNQVNGDPGTNAEFLVNYLGAMQLQRIELPNGNANPGKIHGRFSLDVGGGGAGFTPFPGPVQGIALVR